MEARKRGRPRKVEVEQTATEPKAPKAPKASKKGPRRNAAGHLVCLKTELMEMSESEVAEFRANGGFCVSRY